MIEQMQNEKSAILREYTLKTQVFDFYKLPKHKLVMSVIHNQNRKLPALTKNFTDGPLGLFAIHR